MLVEMPSDLLMVRDQLAEQYLKVQGMLVEMQLTLLIVKDHLAEQ